MRIESAVTSISWIPSEAVQGLPKVPFTMSVAHYDDAPPERLVDIESMHRADQFREANELKAWIEVKDGMIVGHGQSGGGRIGMTRLKVGPKELRVPAVALPTIQNAEPGAGFVRFTQTAGGRTGAPAPRSVRGKPYFQWHSAIAWTTLELTIHADGATDHEFTGASPFPRHWLYDETGALVGKSGTIDFDKWYRESHEANTPWGAEDSETLVTAVESSLERELADRLMSGGGRTKPKRVDEGDTVFEQGADNDDTLMLILDGVLTAEVDGEIVGEVGPGAIVGERGALEGQRTATLRARTPAKLVEFSASDLERAELAEVAAGHAREDG